MYIKVIALYCTILFSMNTTKSNLNLMFLQFWSIILSIKVLGDPEVTANLYCNFAYLYWEGCVICSIHLR